MNSYVSPGLIDLTREPNFCLGAIEIRPATREVLANEERDVLEPRVMQVLVALSRRRDEVVSRDELITSCWAGRMVGDDAINRCIGRVRRLSETYGGFVLETIPRIGYRLVAKDAPPALAQDDSVREGASKPRQGTLRTIPRRYLLAAGALVFLAIVVVGVVFLWRTLDRDAAMRSTAGFSIAVLPFTPSTGDREAEQLADSVSTSIADMLVSEGLNVVSPAKARLFRGASKADAAQALHADFVVDGEIRREDGRIKIPVRIIDGASGTTLVADSVESADPASVPEAVATWVTGCGWGWLPSLDPSSPRDVQVVAALLKAVNHLRNPSETVYAYDFAKRLAALRPNDGFAHLLHAVTAALIMPGRPQEYRLPVVREAQAAAGRVLRLDPDAGDANAVLAEMTPPFNWTVRERYLRQGLRMRPTAPLVYMDLIALRMNAGYLRLGGRMAEEAFSNHPHFDITTLEAINARLWGGDAAVARPLIARAMKFYPAQARFPAKMFEATAFDGALDDADALLRDPAVAPLLLPQSEGRTYTTILAALRHGRAVDVNAVVGNCLKVQGHTQEFRHTCFVALVKLGRLDDAFRMADLLYPDQRGATQAEIERKWLAQIPLNPAYLVIPATEPLRADPRYRDLVERVGLLQFWKERGLAPDFCAAEKAPVCAELKS